MSKKPSKTKAQEALQFLDDLDFSVDDVPSSLDVPLVEGAPGTPQPSSSKRPSFEISSAADEADKKGEDLGDKEAEDALAFLNDLTQKSSTPRPSSVPPPPAPAPASTSTPASSSSSTSTGPPPPSAEPLNVPTTTPSAPAAATSSWGGSSWGIPSSTSLWGTASAALQQARDAAEALQREGSKAVQGAVGDMAAEVKLRESAGGVVEEGRKWGGGMLDLVKKGVDLGKLRQDLLQASQHSLTNLLATIAPPISEHEVIEIWLTHDMAGYEGVDGLVYRGLSKILEQVEGGELVVNKGKDDVPRVAAGGKERDLNPIEGFEAGFKLAEASLQELIKQHEGTPLHPAPNGLPVTVSPVFLRIQPILAPLPFPEPTILLPTLASIHSSSNPTTPSSTVPPPVSAPVAAPLHLYFLLLLYDPSHLLRHSTITQAVPNQWMDIPYEENEWVEEALVDVIRKGVEVVGQDYVGRRMGILKGVDEVTEEVKEKVEGEGEVKKE